MAWHRGRVRPPRGMGLSAGPPRDRAPARPIRAAHFFFPKDVWRELRDAGRIVEHPVFPDRVGPAARRIEGAGDVEDVIALLRLNYERVNAGRPERR